MFKLVEFLFAFLQFLRLFVVFFFCFIEVSYCLQILQERCVLCVFFTNFIFNLVFVASWFSPSHRFNCILMCCFLADVCNLSTHLHVSFISKCIYLCTHLECLRQEFLFFLHFRCFYSNNNHFNWNGVT